MLTVTAGPIVEEFLFRRLILTGLMYVLGRLQMHRDLNVFVSNDPMRTIKTDLTNVTAHPNNSVCSQTNHTFAASTSRPPQPVATCHLPPRRLPPEKS
jgi:hypothetical protein